MFSFESIAKSFIVSVYIFTALPSSTLPKDIHLYNTEDNDGVEYYDCVMLETIPYCRRPGFPTDLRRNNQTSACHHEGKNLTFEEMHRQNTTPNQIVREFQSSLEKAEDYALYLSGHINSSALCQCVTRSFGKNCEYQIISATWNTRFDESRKWQNDQKKNSSLQMQLYQKPLCYTTLTCEHGLLCLDWRDICDGRQQCINGTDEEACDLLEFNECEDDEYRCSNGMCIPDSYFLDGEHDCMDYSDEQKPFDSSTCAYLANVFNCDEHLCAVGEWSCGDGQCIPERNRYEWQEYKPNAQCHSMREYMHMCELSDRYALWTSISGTCYSRTAVNELDEGWVDHDQMPETDCLYLVKCALSDGVEPNCPCHGLDCEHNIAQACSPILSYPRKGLLTPYLTAHYMANRTWSGKKQPDFYTMSGSIRCRGYQAKTVLNESIWLTNNTDKRHLALQSTFCSHRGILKITDGPQFYSSCYENVSRSLNKRLPYAFFDVCEQCISQYRINDGIRDCLGGEDEQLQPINTCPNRTRRHRYQCSPQLGTCLLVKTLGDSVTDCTEGGDEFAYGSGEALSKTTCKKSGDDACRFLREYILKSRNSSSHSTQTITNGKMAFRSYCNTFWDLKDQSDESLNTCRSWFCAQNEFQCRTGQCIPSHYVCDGEWDCADASDELFDIDYLSPHNQTRVLMKEKTNCTKMMSSSPGAFHDFCNTTTEYPCLLINFTRLSNIFRTRPCINISQIGDGRIDCLGGLDERNTQTHCNEMNQLGFTLQCRSTPNVCIDEPKLCTNRAQCPDKTDDLSFCEDPPIGCSGVKDFLCMNGTCLEGVHCDEKIDCKYGEDEYWCSPNRLQTGANQYRVSKRRDQMNFQKYVVLPRYPPESSGKEIAIKKEGKSLVKRSASVDTSPSIAALKCNRGVAVLHYTNVIVCFCPPPYYGEYCEYHSDRITGYVYLDFSRSPYTHSPVNSPILLKVLILFMHENQVVHSHQYHSRPSFDLAQSQAAKKKYYLIYSREAKRLEKKAHRMINRTSIVDHSPYSIRYEVYELKPNSKITIVAVWRYPIIFDFLPSFRHAKILRYADRQSEPLHSPCQPNPCNSLNAECHILQNEPKKYVCLCKPDYSGDNCSIRDQYCAKNFCHPDSLCKPTYLGSISGNRLPLCLCPADVSGRRCRLSHDQCSSNPCQNNGTCTPSTSDFTKIYCLCSEDYYGDRCQSGKEKVDIRVSKNNVSGVSVIQYLQIEFTKMDLTLKQQLLLEQPADHLHYRYATNTAPEIVLLKNYQDAHSKYPRIFLLLSAMKEKNIKSSTALTDKNLCFNVDQVFPNISVYQYHSICRNSSLPLRPLCFYDDSYLCICEVDNYRAECFGYDHQLDQCSRCFSQGLCVRGDLQKKEEFLCLCKDCHYGDQCQYSSEGFSFTFEQVYLFDLQSETASTRQLKFCLLVTFICLCWIIGALNNLFTFITFYRSKFLRTGVGNYLLVGSVINGIALSFVAFRLIHILLNMTGYGTTDNLTVNKILCKSVPYALAISSQLSYWLMSTVAIERLYITWNIKGTWLKKPRVARWIMFILMIIISLVNAPQIVFYSTLFDTKDGVSHATCVLIYTHNFWLQLSQVINYVSSLLPLIINIICTGGIMFLITRQKLLANKKSAPSMTATDVQTISETEEIKTAFPNRSRFTLLSSIVLHENRDLIFGPAITILPQLFSLPLLILTGTMGCGDFANTTIRRAFVILISIFYIPQMASFLLYVRFSSIYYSHFRSTAIGKKMIFLSKCCRRRTKQSTTHSEPSRCVLSNIIELENDASTEKNG